MPEFRPAAAGVPRPNIGPVRLRIAVSALGHRPSTVTNMDLTGVQWHISEVSLLD
jgi:hypothetical protein